MFVPYIQSKLDDSVKVVCVDFAFRMLEIALGKSGDTHTNYVCSEIETVGFARSEFDAIVCCSTFLHFHDKRPAVKNMTNMLASGGSAFICHTANRKTINAIHRSIPDTIQMNDLLDHAGLTGIIIRDADDYYLTEGTKPKLQMLPFIPSLMGKYQRYWLKSRIMFIEKRRYI